MKFPIIDKLRKLVNDNFGGEWGGAITFLGIAVLLLYIAAKFVVCVVEGTWLK